jgi:hypothetical protein
MSLINNDDDQIVIDENKKYFDDLVGEGRKFKDPEQLARGKWHADKTIELMEKRMDALRAEYQKEREQNLTRAQLEEVIEKFSKQPLASNANPIVNEDRTPVFDPNQLETLVASNYEKMREKERQDQNYRMVQEKAMTRFGANYKQSLAETMNDLGLSPADVETMARNNPKVFIKTFGLDALPPAQNFQAPPRSGFTPFQPTGGAHKSWSYYQEMRKNKPDEYYAQKTQNKMMDDYAALGEKFEDGDFHQEY